MLRPHIRCAAEAEAEVALDRRERVVDVNPLAIEIQDLLELGARLNSKAR